MLIVDGQGRIVLGNSQTERMVGYEPKALVGHAVKILVPESLRGWHAQHRAAYNGNPQTCPVDSGFELWARRKVGSACSQCGLLKPVSD
jgi:PAS domain S-box-containing protein